VPSGPAPTAQHTQPDMECCKRSEASLAQHGELQLLSSQQLMLCVPWLSSQQDQADQLLGSASLDRMMQHSNALAGSTQQEQQGQL
jgi:hypothetical protein